MKKIIIIAVHPDDETLGCGGTILKHKKEGDEVHWLIITNISKENGFSDENIKKRNEEINIVANLYKFDSVTNLGFPAIKLETIPKHILVEAIGSVINKIKPSTIYLQHSGDAHSEHKAVFDASYACTKSFRYPFLKEVFAMETLSETDFAAPLVQNHFLPNYFNDITDFLDQKIEIMKTYTSEISEHPFPRSEKSIRALAILRGIQAGVDFSEAFVILKMISK
jgi:LmbE family N-acetylglucosaminyl deacetylase